MIVRSIKDNPEKVLSSFDFFNDYVDTHIWCLTAFPEIIPALDVAYQNYFKEAIAHVLYPTH